MNEHEDIIKDIDLANEIARSSQNIEILLEGLALALPTDHPARPFLARARAEAHTLRTAIADAGLA